MPGPAAQEAPDVLQTSEQQVNNRHMELFENEARQLTIDGGSNGGSNHGGKINSKGTELHIDGSMWWWSVLGYLLGGERLR